jgi:hypothetical protein
MEEIRSACKILFGKPEASKPLALSKRGYNNKIKMDLEV